MLPPASVFDLCLSSHLSAGLLHKYDTRSCGTWTEGTTVSWRSKRWLPPFETSGCMRLSSRPTKSPKLRVTETAAAVVIAVKCTPPLPTRYLQPAVAPQEIVLPCAILGGKVGAGTRAIAGVARNTSGSARRYAGWAKFLPHWRWEKAIGLVVVLFSSLIVFFAFQRGSMGRSVHATQGNKR